MRVGFVGLGIMGKPMARNLLRAGFEVTVFSRSPGPVEEVVADGARRATSLADLAAGRDVVITMILDSPDVEAVVLGADGILDHADPGTVIVDMSTVRPETARKVAAAAAAKGCGALDAPVSGGDVGAREGTLSIMVGGEAADLERARPVLEAMGTTIEHVGPAGAGQTVKAANQLIISGTLAVLAEAVVMLEACGVDPTTALRVLDGGMAQSRILERKGPQMVERRFDPGFRVDLHLKDMGIVLATARERDVAVPVAGLVTQLLASLQATGRGTLDHSALFLLTEELSGRRSERSDGSR
ncbi:MAG: 2-hydroxy-3-oxopropionate reductase [Actinobacteria bacterium]|nr:2-hydroxy-3-oxopropionate reductase [Actinomycetota bacterium]